MRYEYVCENCENTFEVNKSIESRNDPIFDPCNFCGEMAVVRSVCGGHFTMGEGATEGNGYSITKRSNEILRDGAKRQNEQNQSKKA